MSNDPSLQQIEELVKSERVVLFMKGNRHFPQCGFSHTVIQLLNELLPQYKTINVLSDPEIRQGIKDYSNWPTIPQLYIDGEFIGGCDIIKEMFASGDLHQKLGVEVKELEPPKVLITEAAIKQLRDSLGDAVEGDKVQLSVSANFEHSLGLGPIEQGAIRANSELEVYVERASVERANGISIDFIDGPNGAGFKIDNPNAPSQVEPISAKEVAAKLKSGDFEEFFDVRTQSERDTASVESARELDDEAVAYIEELAKDTPIVFMCHHGQRSRAAAEHFRDLGFKKLYNMSGGIDAWSVEVDSSVPRY